MDRAEKRRLERERQKLNGLNMKEDEVNRQWYSQLPVSRKIFIGKFIERRTIENDNLVAAIMDKCIIGSLDDNTSIDIRLMKKVVDDCNGYILEYKEFLDKYKDGGFDMIENEENREEIIKAIKCMINTGLPKVKGMAMLKRDHNIPAVELSDLWVECKEEIRKDPNLISVKKYNAIRDHIMVYINNGSDPETCIDMIKREFKVSDDIINDLWKECKVEASEIGIEKTCGYDEKPSPEIAPAPRNSVIDGLKVVNATLEIDGRYNSYKKNNEGVELPDGTRFLSKEEVLINKTSDMEEYNNRVKKLNDELKKLNNEHEYYMNRWTELEAVFDI